MGLSDFSDWVKISSIHGKTRIRSNRVSVQSATQLSENAAQTIYQRLKAATDQVNSFTIVGSVIVFDRIGFSEPSRCRWFELKEQTLKKLITTALSGLALLMLGAIAIPQEAKAAPASQTQGGVTCYNQNISPTTWPGYNFWYCGQSNADFGPTDAGYLADQGVYAKTQLFNKGVKIFVFTDATDAVNFCGGSVTSPAGAQPLIPVSQCFSYSKLQNLRGLTSTGPSSTFPYSVVFEQYTDAYSGHLVNQQPALGHSPNFMPFALLHEQGHHVDWLLGSLVNNSTYVSQSTTFTTLLNKDYAAITALDAVNKNGCAATGSGLFKTWADTTDMYICANLGNGPGVRTGSPYTNTETNANLMQNTYPNIYGPFSPPPAPISPYQELLASLNPIVSGGFNQVGPEINYTTQNGGAWLGKFTCLNTLLQNLAATGTLNTACH